MILPPSDLANDLMNSDLLSMLILSIAYMTSENSALDDATTGLMAEWHNEGNVFLPERTRASLAPILTN